MYSDDPIISEAAGFAIGLTILDIPNEQAIQEFITFTHDYQNL